MDATGGCYRAAVRFVMKTAKPRAWPARRPTSASAAEAEEQLLRDALHDTLTGLPNRALFTDRLERSISRLTRDAEHHFAVLFLDLDRFKVINDSLGHGCGDQLLVSFAKRLVECLRPSDTVARLGGDEFTILLEDPREPDHAAGVADRILDSLKKPFMLGAHEVYISTSIGHRHERHTILAAAGCSA